MDRATPQDPIEGQPPATPDQAESGAHAPVAEPDANPPHTTKGGITAPKFGSAGSGGAELEPGPRKN